MREAGTAAVFVLHERADAWAVADRVLVLLDGRIHANATPHRLLNAPPSAAVALFLGFDGELTIGDESVLTRAVHVVLGPDGDLSGTVTRRVGVADGYRLEVQTERGSVWAFDPTAHLDVGGDVRVTVRGGARFPAVEPTRRDGE